MDDFKNAFQQGMARFDGLRRGLEDQLDGSNLFSGQLGKEPANPLKEVADFGGNPGNLRMFMSVPALSTGVASSLHAHTGSGQGTSRQAGEPARAPALVIALHGCLQTASSYDQGSGWSALAERCGFALVMPGQRPANNPNRCFNWFAPEHAARDAGEARSIRQMIDYMVTHHGIDPQRIFVAGLSAGGAMAANLMAVYPEVFAAGAVIAGLPFGSASSMPEALASMAQGRNQSPAQWGRQARAASAHPGPWPRLSVWHGSADAVVNPANAESLIGQWSDLHGLDGSPVEQIVAGHRRRVWQAPDGSELLESYTIAGMGHGVPVAANGGAVGAFHLEAGICSTSHIARFWGLLEAAELASTTDGAKPSARPMEGDRRQVMPSGISDQTRTHITEALRQAGLLDPPPRGAPGQAASGTDPRAIVASTLRSLGLLKE